MRPCREIPSSQLGFTSAQLHGTYRCLGYHLLKNMWGRGVEKTDQGKRYKIETVFWAGEPPNLLDSQLYRGPWQTTLTLQYPAKSKKDVKRYTERKDLESPSHTRLSIGESDQNQSRHLPPFWDQRVYDLQDCCGGQSKQWWVQLYLTSCVWNS